jgi:hypothetical protein
MRKFLFKLGNKIRAFFYGRNGFDDLAKLCFIASIVLFLIYGFLPYGIAKLIFSLLTYGLMGYSYFRILSKNVYKRVAENKKYLGFINISKSRWNQRKTHKFYRCPKCKTWLRVPKGRGKITITCVKCSTKFDKRT